MGYKKKFSVGDFFTSHFEDYVHDFLLREDCYKLTLEWDDIEDGTKVVVFNDDPHTCITLDTWKEFWSNYPEWYLPAYVLFVNNNKGNRISQMTPEMIYDEWMGIEDDIFTIDSHSYTVAFGTKNGEWKCS